MDPLKLDERDLLLAEMRHRLQNSFQLITSLIRLQSRTAAPAEAHRFAHLAAAVTALGNVQHLLATSGSEAFALHLAAVGEQWRQVLGGRGIALDLVAQDVPVPPRVATPLALMLHELLTNCAEHAFPGGRAGRVEVRFEPTGPDAAVLVVADDGVGFDPDAAPSSGLGRRLIGMLAAQFDGAVTHEAGPGTRVRVSVPLPAGL